MYAPVDSSITRIEAVICLFNHHLLACKPSQFSIVDMQVVVASAIMDDSHHKFFICFYCSEEASVDWLR